MTLLRTTDTKLKSAKPRRVRLRSLAGRAVCGLLSVAAILTLHGQVQAQTTIWSSTLTVRAINPTVLGCGDATSSAKCTTYLSDNDFTYDRTTFVVTSINIYGPSFLRITVDEGIPDAAENLTLNVDGRAFAFEDQACCPNSLWQKSIDRSRPESTEWRRLGGMAMGKKPAARQPSPMWVTTADLPTSAGHPFFERLNRVLEEAGFDAFVEGLCAVFYASRLGRPSLRPGRYFRLLFIGYFEGLSSERGIAWRVADSLSLRAFLDLDVTEAPPNHSTLSRTRRLIDVETHVAVFTWVLERLAGAGLVQGKTVGVDATTLEANAAMRSIERRDTGESYEAFVRQLAKASGIETPTRAELARFDRSRKDRKTSNKEWQSPQDPDAKIAKMKDGRTHLAHKAEHGVDLETGAILSVTVQAASEGDSATLPETLTMAAEQVEAVQPAGAEVEEVVADKGYHSDATLVALDEIGVRSYVSEPERGRRCWQDKKTGETPVGKRAAQKALYGNRRRIRGDRGRRLQRRRGELVERPFAHQYETGGLRRVWVRGHENVRKRVLIQAAGCNLGLLLRRLTGVGTPRSLQGRALSAICGLIGRLTALWGRLTASWDFQWTPAGLVGSITHRQAA